MSLMRAHGITGWRRGATLVGKPDFVFRREHVAVFVDGCFWHRHPGCKFAYTPKSRLEFWLPKFARNVARDRLVTRTLRKDGWTVVRVWECELAKAARWPRVARRLERALLAPSCPSGGDSAAVLVKARLLPRSATAPRKRA